MTSIEVSAHQAVVGALKVLRQGRGLGDNKQLPRLGAELLLLLGVTPDDPLTLQLATIRQSIDRAIMSMPPATHDLLRSTFNIDADRADWSERVRIIATTENWSARTVIRRIDGLLPNLAKSLLQPRSQNPYKLSMDTILQTAVSDGLEHVHIIVGSTTREHDGAPPPFVTNTFSVALGGSRANISRQVLPGTVRDLVRVADLAGALATAAGSSPGPSVELCVADVAVADSYLEDHLILVGGPDTNIFMAVASRALVDRFGVAAPIRYQGEDSGYFTCDEIKSDLSGASYLRLEEAGGMHTGFLVHALNPWNPARTITIVSGIRATGTQAALLALLRGSDDLWGGGRSREPWRTLGGNNRYSPDVSAKVVRASRARVVHGTDLIAPARTIDIPPNRRIPQRHAVVGFVYEE